MDHCLSFEHIFLVVLAPYKAGICMLCPYLTETVRTAQFMPASRFNAALSASPVRHTHLQSPGLERSQLIPGIRKKHKHE